VRLLPHQFYIVQHPPSLSFSIYIGRASVNCKVLRNRPFLYFPGFFRRYYVFTRSGFFASPRTFPRTSCYSHEARKVGTCIYAGHTPVASNTIVLTQKSTRGVISAPHHFTTLLMQRLAAQSIEFRCACNFVQGFLYK
jgi:hypothetical protein